jgi:hypothetical protein
MKNNFGFMALISAIIISIILLLIASSLNLTSFYNRSDILDSELKEKSSALAEACVDVAILKLANNQNYNPLNEIVSVETDNCIIQSVTSSNSQKIINIKADYNHYVTNLKIIIDSSDLHVVSWEEI